MIELICALSFPVYSIITCSKCDSVTVLFFNFQKFMYLLTLLIIYIYIYQNISGQHCTGKCGNISRCQAFSWLGISCFLFVGFGISPLNWTHPCIIACDASRGFSTLWYSISQEICTRFCCALLCCGYAIVHNEFTWSIYPYSSGLLCWHWGNR